mmetsp:Transcript_3673/g.4892  ORF Transcript_3673/g.4892 Transcript_3673/m.4892 type:complete len:342 (+) Transcript_3673:26-1051(+)
MVDEDGETITMDGPNKRMKVDDHDTTLVSYADLSMGVRTSSLSNPTLQLTGHSGSVYALEYNPSGSALVSASFDKSLLLWGHSDYENYNILEGHKNAVLDCHWMDEETVVSASADKTVQLWDALTGQRLRKWQGHDAIVNCCAGLSPQLVASAGDDGSCRVWDRRQKSPVSQLPSDFPVLAVTGTEENQLLFAAGIDSKITAWDLKMNKKVYAMTGHTDTVTCLALHPEKTHLLSNSMDSTLKMWDIQPFAQGSKRQIKEFVGHKHNAERGLLKCSWSPDGKMVTAGSADKMVHVWDEFSTQELYLLPGHKGCVNTVVFHPTENVIASGASDKHIFVGELS